MAGSGSGGQHGSHSAPLGLMSCVRESSPSDMVDSEECHHEPKKRRFHPLRGLRRMFRRKERRPPEVVTVSADELSSPADDAQGEARRRSATTLVEDKTRRRSGGGLHSAGLSVSHDSVFSPEQRSGAESGSELESSSSLSIQRSLYLAQSGVQAELLDAVRRRRAREDNNTSDDEEDLGLPRSPSSNSPTTADVLLEKVLKENVNNKSSHSTCSDGSLLSMGSSEMDEDSYGQSSRHSSKLSLHDKRPQAAPHNNTTEPDLEVGELTSAPLSHSAARHKMAVRPKRTHGAPRRSRRLTQLGGATSLPATPEVNEDMSVSGRSTTPDVPDTSSRRESPASTSPLPLSNTQLKSASLPPGTAPVWDENPIKLSRSKSSATNRQLDSITVGEQDETETGKKEETSFFGRLLSRRSGKKKKQVEEPPLDLPQKRMDEKGRYVQELPRFGRNHPAARQRVEPINIPQDRSITRMHVSYSAPTPPNTPPLPEDDILGTRNVFIPGHRLAPADVDMSLQRRSLIKKSLSFRRDDVVPFMSLDTPSLPVGIGSNFEKEEDADKFEDNRVKSINICDERIGVRNESVVEDIITSSVMMQKSEETDHSKVLFTRDETEIKEKLSETTVRKSVSLDSIEECESGVVSTKSSSVESISHQITIPVGTSIVNITQDVETADHLEPSHVVTSSAVKPPEKIRPEPRKSLDELIKDPVVNHPIPAPRPSKRESVESKQSSIPEFLRVQLNHVDSKPAVNVVLSTHNNSGTEANKTVESSSNSVITENKELSHTVTEIQNETKVSVSGMKTEHIEVKTETKIEEDKNECITKKHEMIITANDPIDPDSVQTVNAGKQWSSVPNNTNSNQKFSVVSIMSSNGNDLVKKQTEVNVTTSNQIYQRKAVYKDVCTSTKIEKVQCSVTSNDVSPVKVVLHQKSVSKEKLDEKNYDNKTHLDDVQPQTKVAPLRKKSLPKEVVINEDEKVRKLSIEKVDFKSQNHINDIVRRKSRESTGSDDNIIERNSFGSTDTLASQDSCDVVFRRKSLSREITKQKDEEPELLKVFARRSLKLKDNEIPDELDIITNVPLKSRDSDKENECGDSPPEERKKIKESVLESKVKVETYEKPPILYKYQRSISSNCDEISNTTSILATHRKENNAYEKRQRSRTIPDTKILEPPSSNITQKVLANLFEKEVEVINLDKQNDSCQTEENAIPKFKRIQQRKEEWEKRAQLAMKKTYP